MVLQRAKCDGFHQRILSHGNGRMGLRDNLSVVCGRGVAATAIPLAVGGRNSGGIVWRHVSGDTDAGILRNGPCQSGTGGCGGCEESGGRE